MTEADEIITDELSRPSPLDWRRVPVDDQGGWIAEGVKRHANWWVRAYRWPLLVDLVQWSGTWDAQATTGRVITIPVLSYWILYWRVWWYRRRSAKLPRATARITKEPT